MKRAARLLGFFGGATGVGFGYLAVFLGGPATGLGTNGRGWLIFSSLIAMLLAIAGGWIGTTTSGRSRWSAVALIAVGILGFACIAAYWIVPGVLFFASAGLFLDSRKKVDAQARV